MSSTNAIGLASPTMPIKSENPALRTFQKSSLAASANRVRTPSTPGWPSNIAARVGGALDQLVLRAGVELRGQHGRRLALGEIEIPGVKRVFGRQVENHPVEHLDGDRPGVDDLVQAVECCAVSWRTKARPDPWAAGSRDQLEHRRMSSPRVFPPSRRSASTRLNCQGSSSNPTGRTGKSRYELVEVVAAHPAQDPGKPIADRLSVLGHRVAYQAMHRTDRIASGAESLELFLFHGAQVGGRAVGQNDLECVHMIDRLAIA